MHLFDDHEQRRPLPSGGHRRAFGDRDDFLEEFLEHVGDSQVAAAVVGFRDIEDREAAPGEQLIDGKLLNRDGVLAVEHVGAFQMQELRAQRSGGFDVIAAP